MMKNINEFLEYLYPSLYIPIYLYENDELTDCYPAQEKETFPLATYLSRLLEPDNKVTYTLTNFHSYYGCIKLDRQGSYIIIGPINDFPYSEDSLSAMRKEFTIGNSNTEAFSEFFHKIPTHNLDIFFNILLFINYTVNNSKLTRKDIETTVDYQLDREINQKYVETFYEAKEDSTLLNNYAIEAALTRFIETGNVEGLRKFKDRSKHTKVGVIANNNVRQWKNMFIVAVTLVCRASMRGGLSPSLAYQLSDIYIQQVERLTNTEAIQSLLTQVQIDFANRVANSIVPATADNILHRVIQYVRENTNKNINVSNVAEYVGYSRPSLSRKVKKELGFELSKFIRKTKLEEAKDLLAFSDKSINEISNYLCFADQSHFQKSFKSEYNITPQAYRKSLW
jgi:AraC-like DNA-binding protein